jgi:hypothetical protein
MGPVDSGVGAAAASSVARSGQREQLCGRGRSRARQQPWALRPPWQGAAASPCRRGLFRLQSSAATEAATLPARQGEGARRPARGRRRASALLLLPPLLLVLLLSGAASAAVQDSGQAVVEAGAAAEGPGAGPREGVRRRGRGAAGERGRAPQRTRAAHDSPLPLSSMQVLDASKFRMPRRALLGPARAAGAAGGGSAAGSGAGYGGFTGDSAASAAASAAGGGFSLAVPPVLSLSDLAGGGGGTAGTASGGGGGLGGAGGGLWRAGGLGRRLLRWGEDPSHAARARARAQAITALPQPPPRRRALLTSPLPAPAASPSPRPPRSPSSPSGGLQPALALAALSLPVVPVPQLPVRAQGRIDGV